MKLICYIVGCMIAVPLVFTGIAVGALGGGYVGFQLAGEIGAILGMFAGFGGLLGLLAYFAESESE